MASEKTLTRLDTLIWVLIYGGLFGVVIGLAVRGVAPALGPVMAWVGGAVAVVGVVLIGVRARLRPDA